MEGAQLPRSATVVIRCSEAVAVEEAETAGLAKSLVGTEETPAKRQVLGPDPSAVPFVLTVWTECRGRVGLSVDREEAAAAAQRRQRSPVAMAAREEFPAAAAAAVAARSRVEPQPEEPAATEDVARSVS